MAWFKFVLECLGALFALALFCAAVLVWAGWWVGAIV